ncbi:HU family DNA-binding protein [Pseudolactococcus reticulitermitis]|uniref:HU family DNA-binding protein n=1 Tax=Pseudolactococcus reticulitermitis TaxID=2025039 RepID=UPI00350E35DA
MVRLSDFGRFNVSLKLIRPESQAAFTSKNIEKAKINFRPGKDLQDMLKTLPIKKCHKLNNHSVFKSSHSYIQL